MRTFSVKATALNTCHLIFLRKIGGYSPGDTLTYHCPRNGGYVRKLENGDGKETLSPVCIGMEESGFPLIHIPTPTTPLSDVIEYHAQKYVDRLTHNDRHTGNLL